MSWKLFQINKYTGLTLNPSSTCSLWCACVAGPDLLWTSSCINTLALALCWSTLGVVKEGTHFYAHISSRSGLTVWLRECL